MDQEADNNSVFILISDSNDSILEGKKLMAIGTVEEISRYKRQLEDYGHQGKLTTAENRRSWVDDTPLISKFCLEELDGMIYTRSNIESAQLQKDQLVDNLNLTLKTLESVQDSFPLEAVHYETVLRTVKKRLAELKAKKLAIEMI